MAKAGALWHLTPAGIARTGALFDPTDLSTVLALLPSEPHRAMVRLGIDAALTRSALAGRGDIGWPSFALYGAPGGLKTGTARLLGRLFGLSDADHVVMATDRGRADLLGGKDHLGKWHPAPTLSHPIITLDELDKAKSEARPPGCAPRRPAPAPGDDLHNRPRNRDGVPPGRPGHIREWATTGDRPGQDHGVTRPGGR